MSAPFHLLRTDGLTSAQLTHLLDVAQRFADDPLHRPDALLGRTVVLYFAKPSTRTRLSMGTAVANLGGTPLFVGAEQLQLGRGETLADTARVVSAYATLFAIRTFDDADVQAFADAASIPVVNGLTDTHHPCQSLADLLTLRQEVGDLAGCRVAYVGDGNNVATSLMQALMLVGAELRVATPESLALDEALVGAARRTAGQTGGTLSVGTDPEQAVAGVHAVYTDTWVSMDDDDRDERKRLLEPFRVDDDLMARADDEAIFLHCLPAHRGDEVTAEVIDGPASRVFQQAANRLPTAAALFSVLVDGSLAEVG